MDEPKRPYYDHELARRNRAKREAEALSTIRAIKKLLGFGKCVIIGTDGKRYKEIDRGSR